MASKEFAEDLNEIGTALVDADFTLVNKKKSYVSRFWTYIQGKLSASAVTVASLVTSGTVDGRDVSADGSTLDAHVASTSNPHSVTAAQAGAVAVASHAAHSIVARSANSTGDVADFSIGTDEGVFNVAGVLTSQKVQTANVADGAITGAKIVQSGTLDIGSTSITTTGDVTTATLKSGAGSPEGATTAGVGAIYRDTTNGVIYTKLSGTGNTGWAKVDRCESGVYTPTATIVSNLDSITPRPAQYIRVGNRVVVAGDVAFDATAGLSVSFSLTLPVASNLSASTDLSGAGGSWGVRIVGDTTSDQAICTVNNSITSATAAVVMFMYEVK